MVILKVSYDFVTRLYESKGGRRKYDNNSMFNVEICNVIFG